MSLRPRPVPVAAVLGLSLLLTGCGANFEAQTYQVRAGADGTNAAVGAIAIRNMALAPPESGETHEAGADAEVRLTLTNDGPEDDRLVEVTSSAAESVEMHEDGAQADAVDVPRLGTTGDRLTLQLTGLTQDLRPGRYVEITLRFERNGEITLSVPVATTGEYDDHRERNEHFPWVSEH